MNDTLSNECTNEPRTGSTTKDGVWLALPSSMTIETVAQVSATVSQFQFSQENPLVLDAGQLEVVTTPGVQFLVALSKTLESAGTHLQLIHCRPSVGDVFADLGLAEQFQKWGG